MAVEGIALTRDERSYVTVNINRLSIASGVSIFST